MATRPGFIWSGTEWVAIGQEAIVNPFYYQATAPTTPSTGDIWIESDVDVPSVDSAQFLRWRKTMAGGETSLSGNDDSSLPLGYTPGYEQLYINGVLMVRGQDYTATTGTTVTGLTALTVNDVVEVFSTLARNVADVYTQTQSDTKYVAKSTTPAFRLKQTVVQSIPHNTNAFLLFNSEDLDTEDGHSTVTNTSRYTATVAGWYNVRGNYQSAHNITGNRLAFITKNGTITVAQTGRSASSTSNSMGLEVSGLVYLNGTTDYIEVGCFQSSGAALNTNATFSSLFEGFWVRS